MKKILFLAIIVQPIFAMNPPLAQPKPRKPSAPLVHNEQIHTISSDAQSDWELKLEEQLILPTLIGIQDSFNKYEYEYLRAAFYKKLPEVMQCINRGARVNTKGKTGFNALHLALYQGKVNYTLIFFLMANKVDVTAMNNSKQTPLNFAVQSLIHSQKKDDWNIVHFLFTQMIELGAIPSDEDIMLIADDNDVHPAIKHLIQTSAQTTTERIKHTICTER